MAYWLLKTEPDCYNWSRMRDDKKTVWDGVVNALALKHIRTMKPGDQALFYHTADERQAVGIVEVVSDPYPDPKLGDERLAVVDVKIKSTLDRPVSLDEIKTDGKFAGWDLLRISRLSIVPTPPAMWSHLLKIAAEPLPEKPARPAKRKTVRAK